MSAATGNNYETFFYGEDHETQFVRLYPSSAETRITFAIIHGGYWKKKYGIDTAGIDSLVPFLTSRGFGVCLVEYRRVGHKGGGWPGTNDDVMKALETLQGVLSNADSKGHKVILLGHSAGGTLALYASCKLDKLSNDVSIALCVAVAPIGNLCEGYERKLSDDGDAIPLYMGCSPITVPSAAIGSTISPSTAEDSICPYMLASPHLLLPLRVLCLISVGSLDIDVPPDMVETFHADSVTSHENYVLKLKADMSSEGPFSPADVPSQGNVSRSASSNIKFELPAAPELLLISGADHYNILDANHESWLRLFEKIKKMIEV